MFLMRDSLENAYKTGILQLALRHGVWNFEGFGSRCVGLREGLRVWGLGHELLLQVRTLH